MKAQNNWRRSLSQSQLPSEEIDQVAYPLLFLFLYSGPTINTQINKIEKSGETFIIEQRIGCPLKQIPIRKSMCPLCLSILFSFVPPQSSCLANTFIWHDKFGTRSSTIQYSHDSSYMKNI